MENRYSVYGDLVSVYVMHSLVTFWESGCFSKVQQQTSIIEQGLASHGRKSDLRVREEITCRPDAQIMYRDYNQTILSQQIE